MPTINLQEKTEALPGTVTSYWFENESIGLKKTLFHRIAIPLKAFDSGLEYEDEPVETEIIFDPYELKLDDPRKLNGLNLSHENYPEAEISVYVGAAHNPCRVNALTFQEVGENEFLVRGDLLVEFDNEWVADNEPFSFETRVTYVEEDSHMLSVVSA